MGLCWRGWFVCWLGRCRGSVLLLLRRCWVVSRFFLVALFWWRSIRLGSPSGRRGVNNVNWRRVVRLVDQNRKFVVR